MGKNQVENIEMTADQNDEAEEGLGGCSSCLVFFFTVLTILLFPLTMWSAIKIIAEYERAVIFRVGRISGNKAVGPGLFFIIPCTDSFIKVDMRTISFDIPPQEVLTKDSVTIRVDAVVYYRIGNAIASVKNVENASTATRLLAQTTLRNILGTRTLTEVLSERESISEEIQQIL